MSDTLTMNTNPQKRSLTEQQMSVTHREKIMVDSTTPARQPDWLDMKGLAQYLCTSKKQIQRMLGSGRLPPADCNLSPTRSVKGRRWRRQTISDFLESQS